MRLFTALSHGYLKKTTKGERGISTQQDALDTASLNTYNPKN